jgi:2,4-dienoyl-CoA reductase-like NADH-dependent reductase (Old Yellow Enzyme family)
MRLEHTGPHPHAPSCRPSGLWGPAERARSILPGYLDKVLAMTSPMSESEIADVIAGYARSAASASEIGFDGVAIHGAHGYLIDTFLWSSTNQRRDHYGGDLAARTRFGAEVVKAIRAEVGSKPILFRFSQWKLQDYAASLFATPAELDVFLGMLTDAGVDIFEASTRRFDEPAFDSSALSLAGWVKKLSGVPAMCVGGVGLSQDLLSSFEGETPAADNLEHVRARLRQAEFDLVAVGRALLVDPLFTQKVRSSAPLEPFAMQAVAKLY